MSGFSNLKNFLKKREKVFILTNQVALLLMIENLKMSLRTKCGNLIKRNEFFIRDYHVALLLVMTFFIRDCHASLAMTSKKSYRITLLVHLSPFY